jgi:hypothetical protein
MTHENDMQAEVLKQWGAVALRGEADDAQAAVIRFLQQLQEGVAATRQPPFANARRPTGEGR